MILFPDVQRKAQDELDAVIGADRLPSWEDRPSLPYIRGVVEETLRCKSSQKDSTAKQSLTHLQGRPALSVVPYHIQ